MSFAIGPERTVHRLGYGAMQLTGPGVWGEPADRDGAIAVLRRAVDLGVTFVDTADSYGPAVNEELIRAALHPYPAELVIATKGGFVRPGPDKWVAVGRPAYLRQQVEMSLRRLDVDTIDLYQLHRVDPEVPLADQVGELDAMRREGKIRCIGLSEVDVATVEAARRVTDIASVQNRYNVADRRYDPVVDYTTSAGIAFIPWFPLGTGVLLRSGSPLTAVATEVGATAAQAALAWLLRRSPAMLPIPGTASLDHLVENMSSVDVRLTDDQFDRLAQLGG